MFAKGSGRTHLMLVAAVIAAAIGCLSCLIGLVLLRESEDLDIHSGRLRMRRYIGPLILAERVRETDYSLSIARLSTLYDRPTWRPVLQRSCMSRVSPHFRYHGTPSDIRSIMLVVKQESYPAPVRSKILREIQSFLEQDNPTAIEDLATRLCNGMEGRAVREH